ncbi:MAG: hypothetical protein JRE40_04325, partial [Deltaproteobacteria bacterium]|nr:hypothetical protein [Deltaproteobacteria bacterium]
MKYRVHSHRNCEELFTTSPGYMSLWSEIRASLDAITDEALAERFCAEYEGKNKSMSALLNKMIKENLVAAGWSPESGIFSEGEYIHSTWRLDFAKEDVSVEVGFNHGEAVAWNLIKPVLASELNHVHKAIQTSAGVIIAATQDLKDAGGFDSAVGTWEKYVSYLRPLRNLLTVPLCIVGLEAPELFCLEHYKEGNRTYGRVSW